jgi:hypothetical protein
MGECYYTGCDGRMLLHWMLDRRLWAAFGWPGNWTDQQRGGKYGNEPSNSAESVTRRNSLLFMVPEISLTRSQGPGYTQSNVSSPCPTSLRPILILSSHAHLAFRFVYIIPFMSQTKFHLRKKKLWLCIISFHVLCGTEENQTPNTLN